MKPIPIYIGFDQVESVAWHTLTHSILHRASVPVSFIPVKRSLFKDFHTRPMDNKQSNEFSFTRFLVPYLNNYEGHAIFMDCDMLVLDDIKKLWDLRNPFKSVQVVKHDYVPRDEIKYLGTTQYKYPRKNWSSVMIFNCGHHHTKILTPEYVNNASGLELHQFKWTEDDYIGELPLEWNHLVSEYPPNPQAKLVHYTVGGPYFNEYANCEYSEAWFNERALMQKCEQRLKLGKRA